MPGSLALLFNIDLSGGHTNNYLLQNVSKALVGRFLVNFAGTILQDTNRYDIYKIFEDLFLSEDEREENILEGIQSEKLCKIRSNAGDKDLSGVDAENALESVYKNKYRIVLDHQVLTDHGDFYRQALYNSLNFELTLAPAFQVVKGSDTSQLVYKLTNIQLEYKAIRSKHLADKATSTYTYGKEFAYDHVVLSEVVELDRGTTSLLNLKMNPQRRSLEGVHLLFIVPYTAGTRDSEYYLNPDITKVDVTINGSPNRLYNEGI